MTEQHLSGEGHFRTKRWQQRAILVSANNDVNGLGEIPKSVGEIPRRPLRYALFCVRACSTAYALPQGCYDVADAAELYVERP